MTRDERQIYNFIEKFKRHIQDHLYFKPLALSCFHHLSDRILDKKDGCFKLFKANIKNMVRDVLPESTHGDYIISELKAFANDKGCDFRDFVAMVNRIYRGGK